MATAGVRAIAARGACPRAAGSGCNSPRPRLRPGPAQEPDQVGHPAPPLAAVILVVALNPALDVTHQLGHVDWAGVNRPDAVHARPGGKGPNVARVLHALGSDVLLAGLAGGHTGNELKAALGTTHVPAVFAEIAGETRRTFAIVDSGQAQTAIFNEPGPQVTEAEYA